MGIGRATQTSGKRASLLMAGIAMLTTGDHGDLNDIASDAPGGIVGARVPACTDHVAHGHGNAAALMATNAGFDSIEDELRDSLQGSPSTLRSESRARRPSPAR
jgi:hypothetical protein